MKNADMPATAVTVEPSAEAIAQRRALRIPVDAKVTHLGLTKREHFAAMAMQAMLSSKYYGDFATEINDDRCTSAQGVANNAIRHADALLEELDK